MLLGVVMCGLDQVCRWWRLVEWASYVKDSRVMLGPDLELSKISPVRVLIEGRALTR